MDQHTKHHFEHEKEREEHNRQVKVHERQADAEQPFVRPWWFAVLAVVLVFVAVLIWTLWGSAYWPR